MFTNRYWLRRDYSTREDAHVRRVPFIIITGFRPKWTWIRGPNHLLGIITPFIVALWHPSPPNFQVISSVLLSVVFVCFFPFVLVMITMCWNNNWQDWISIDWIRFCYLPEIFRISERVWSRRLAVVHDRTRETTRTNETGFLCVGKL